MYSSIYIYSAKADADAILVDIYHDCTSIEQGKKGILKVLGIYSKYLATSKKSSLCQPMLHIQSTGT